MNEETNRQTDRQTDRTGLDRQTGQDWTSCLSVQSCPVCLSVCLFVSSFIRSLLLLTAGRPQTHMQLINEGLSQATHKHACKSRLTMIGMNTSVRCPCEPSRPSFHSSARDTGPVPAGKHRNASMPHKYTEIKACRRPRTNTHVQGITETKACRRPHANRHVGTLTNTAWITLDTRLVVWVAECFPKLRLVLRPLQAVATRPRRLVPRPLQAAATRPRRRVAPAFLPFPPTPAYRPPGLHRPVSGHQYDTGLHQATTTSSSG